MFTLASFFFSAADREEFTRASVSWSCGVFQKAIAGAGFRSRSCLLCQTGRKELMEMLPHQEINEEEASLFDMLWLLLASVIFVPTFQKIPGGSPVLGCFAAGLDLMVSQLFAMYTQLRQSLNLGLCLLATRYWPFEQFSIERLSSMKKYVFGLGSAQVLVTAVVVGFLAHTMLLG
ncbi:K(+) efflux antiporter 1, chloroplastic [Sesamum alatum]|uniref:K(+) efflux antiporter 1, chloroplastic n=1 Tax=Sesamum alatum TaxID=300844 RepID=A0AAE1XW63_9LAMI|nr:K(+) efflux antiporter 1, chloroplastic [Sesamum alatum]